MRHSITEIEKLYKSGDAASRALVWAAMPQLIKDIRRLRRARNAAHKRLEHAVELSGDQLLLTMAAVAHRAVCGYDPERAM